MEGDTGWSRGGGCQTVRETRRLSGERSFLVFACEPMKSMCIYPIWLLPKWSLFLFLFLFHSSSGAFPDAAYKCIPRFWPREPSMVDYGLVPRFNVPRFQGWKLPRSFNGLNRTFGFGPEIPKSFRLVWACIIGHVPLIFWGISL